MKRVHCGGTIRSGLDATAASLTPDIIAAWKETCVEVVAEEIQRLTTSNPAFELLKPVEAVDFFEFIDLPSGELVMSWRVACRARTPD